MIVGTVGSINVRSEKAAEFERVIQSLAAKVRSREPDNLVYQLVRIRGKPNSYKMIEFYRDQAAFEHHRQASYLAESLSQLLACLDGEPQVDLIESVE